MVDTADTAAQPAPAASDPDALTVAEGAELLGITYPHLTQLLNLGAIPAYGEGDERRVRRDELLAYKRERDRKRVHLDNLTRMSIEEGLDKIDYRARFPEWFSDPE